MGGRRFLSEGKLRRLVEGKARITSGGGSLCASDVTTSGVWETFNTSSVTQIATLILISSSLVRVVFKKGKLVIKHFLTCTGVELCTQFTYIYRIGNDVDRRMSLIGRYKDWWIDNNRLNMYFKLNYGIQAKGILKSDKFSIFLQLTWNSRRAVGVMIVIEGKEENYCPKCH